jgi:ketosteroid isomerase-like protein
MRKMIVCLFLALAVPVMAQVPPNTDEATAAITQLREGLITSFNKGDIDGLLSYLDPNVVVTWQNGEVCRGPEEVRAFYQRMMSGDNRVVREIHCEPEVVGRHIYGDWAVSWGNLHDHFVLNDGSDLPFNSVFTATIVKRGDRWYVAAFHTSVSAFQNPVLSLAEHRIGLWLGLGGAAVGLILGLIVSRLFAAKRRSA